MTRRTSAVSALAALAGAVSIATAAPAGNATLNIVMVLDGLRPDSITAEETPNLWRLRQEGVNFANGHSVFPTVTRTNATAIATGTYPDRNGMFGNTLYVRAVDANHAFGNDDQGTCFVSTRRRAAAWCSSRALRKSSADAARRLRW
jgi:predicted AlkP superfamily pyrophosphatase or phosphodiesterase